MLDWEEANASGIATHCLSRGRYELARKYHQKLMDSHARYINRELKDPADIEHAVRVLKDYEAKLPEFPLLVATRTRLLKALARHPDGVDRDAFKGELKHEAATAHGVICNQLARGGWLRQEKVGKSSVLYPSAVPPGTDAAFLEAYLPTAGELEQRARTAKPLATLDLDVGRIATGPARGAREGRPDPALEQFLFAVGDEPDWGPSRPAGRPAPKRPGIGGLALFGCLGSIGLVVALAVLGTATGPARTGRFKAGDRAALFRPGGAGDTPVSGEDRAFAVDNGTLSQVLEPGPTASRVRILEGGHKGATGWVEDPYLVPSSEPAE